MKKGIVAILLTATIPFFVFAYTSPGRQTGFVNDFSGTLSTQEKSQLETILSNYEKQSGNEIAIAIVPSLGDETVETYAVKLEEDWKVGKKGKDNGLLLLVAMNERKMRIEVGYGLEPYVTDAQASSIIRNILTPAFKEGKYSEGISSAVATIIQVLNGQVDAVSTDTSSAPHENWFFWGIFIFIWLGSILSRSRSWWLGGVLGGIAGIVIGFVFGFVFTGIIWTIVLAVVGLIFDFFVSKAYASSVTRGIRPPWWIGGGGRGFGGGGFGGFGGGSSGGGGASGGW